MLRTLHSAYSFGTNTCRLADTLAHLRSLKRETDLIAGLQHCHLFTRYRQDAIRALRALMDGDVENAQPECLVVIVLQLAADVSLAGSYPDSARITMLMERFLRQMLTLNSAWRETLRMAYRLTRIGSMETLVERFAEGLKTITSTASVPLVASMRCVQETLYLLDIFGKYSPCAL